MAGWATADAWTIHQVARRDNGVLEREIRKARWAIADDALTTVDSEVMRGLRAE